MEQISIEEIVKDIALFRVKSELDATDKKSMISGVVDYAEDQDKMRKIIFAVLAERPFGIIAGGPESYRICERVSDSILESMLLELNRREEMEAVDEFERVLSSPRADNPGKEARDLASKLYTQLLLKARDKDEEENGTYFQDIYMRNISHRVNMIARHYQTLIDNGDL